MAPSGITCGLPSGRTVASQQVCRSGPLDSGLWERSFSKRSRTFGQGICGAPYPSRFCSAFGFRFAVAIIPLLWFHLHSCQPDFSSVLRCGLSTFASALTREIPLTTASHLSSRLASLERDISSQSLTQRRTFSKSLFWLVFLMEF